MRTDIEAAAIAAALAAFAGRAPRGVRSPLPRSGSGSKERFGRRLGSSGGLLALLGGKAVERSP